MSKDPAYISTSVQFNHILPFLHENDFSSYMESDSVLKNHFVDYMRTTCPAKYFGYAIEEWVISLCQEAEFDEIEKHKAFLLSCQSIIPRAITRLLKQMIVTPTPQLEWCYQHFPNREISAQRNALEIILHGPHNQFTRAIFYNQSSNFVPFQQRPAQYPQEIAVEIERYVKLLLDHGARASHGRNLIHLLLSNELAIVTPHLLKMLFDASGAEGAREAEGGREAREAGEGGAAERERGGGGAFDASFYAMIPTLFHQTCESSVTFMNTLNVLEMLIRYDNVRGYLERKLQFRNAVGLNNGCTIVNFLASQFTNMVTLGDVVIQQRDVCRKFESILLDLFAKDPTTINLVDDTFRQATTLMTLLTLPTNYPSKTQFLRRVLDLTISEINFSAKQPLTNQNVFHVIATHHRQAELFMTVIHRANVQGTGGTGGTRGTGGAGGGAWGTGGATNGDGEDDGSGRYRHTITPSFLLTFLDLCVATFLDMGPHTVANMVDQLSSIVPCLVLDTTVTNKMTVFNQVVSAEMVTPNEFNRLCHFIFTQAEDGTVSAFFDSKSRRFAAFMLRHFMEHIRSTKYLPVMLNRLRSYCPSIVESLGNMKTEENGIPLPMFIFGQLRSQAEFVTGRVLDTLTQFSTFQLRDQQSKYLKQNLLHVLFMGTNLESLTAEHIPFVRSLLFDYKIDPNQQDRYGNTAFHYLVQCGKAQTMYRWYNWCHRNSFVNTATSTTNNGGGGGNGGGHGGNGSGHGNGSGGSGSDGSGSGDSSSTASLAFSLTRLDSDVCGNMRSWVQYRGDVVVDGEGGEEAEESYGEVFRQLIDLMLSADADASVLNKQGRSPLLLLAALGRLDTFVHIVNRMAEDSKTSETSTTSKTSETSAETIRRAMQPDKEGDTVLHWLCMRAMHETTSSPAIVPVMQMIIDCSPVFGVDPFHVNKSGRTCCNEMFIDAMATRPSVIHPFIVDLLRLFGPRVTRGGHIFYNITHMLCDYMKHGSVYPESTVTVIKDIFAYLLANMETPDDFRNACGNGKNTPLHLVVQCMPSQLDAMIQWFVLFGHADIDAENSRHKTPRGMSSAARARGHHIAIDFLNGPPPPSSIEGEVGGVGGTVKKEGPERES